MSDFTKCITHTLRYEGVSENSPGLVDHPSDRGGITKYGISYEFVKNTGNTNLFDMNFDGKLTKEDIRNLTFDAALEAYKLYFWDYYFLDDIEDNRKAFLIFDASVNHGYKTATKLIQRALNSSGYQLSIDGIWGPKTKASLVDCPVEDFIKNFQEKRRALYKAIVKNNPSQNVFLKGWLRRVDMTDRDLNYV